jgi:hypothetical protein
MSNDLILSNAKIPAHLTARIGVPSALAQSISAGLSAAGASGPRISIKGSRFRIKDGDTETVLDTLALDVVVVGANPRLSKTWYAAAWNPDAEPSEPDCFSVDGVGPDASIAQPPSDMCASCPNNAWGSKTGPQGQQLKACADKKRLAVVSADDPEGPIYLLEVTPAALKGLNQYQKELTMRGIPPEVVKTRVSFDSDASFPKLKFGFGGFLEADQQAVVDQLFGTPAVLDVTGEKKAEAPAPAPAITRPAPVIEKPKAVAPAPKPAPAPVAEEAPAAPAAPKRGFGAAKPAAAPKAAPKAAPVQEASPEMSLADEIAALVGEVGADDA